MIRTAAAAALVLALLAGAPATAASIFSFVEAPGMQYGTVNFTYGGVEEFDGVRGYQSSYATDFYGSDIHATISGFTASAADQFGGAFGGGGYASAGNPTTVSFTSGPAVNYLGLWASALDGGNSIAFYSHGVRLASFDLVERLAALTDATAYRGNPNAAYRGRNGGEAYAFFNFISDTGFDRVELSRNGGGGFELDNLTVGFAGAGAVPEPATWATLVLGFGLVGSAARRRRAGRILPAVC